MKSPKANNSSNYFLYLGVGIVAALFFVVMWLSWTFASGETFESFVASFTEEGTAQVSLSFRDSLIYSYDVTKVTFSEDGMSLVRNSDKTDVVLMSPVNLFDAGQYPYTDRIIGFSETASVGDGSAINYQISTDEQNWYYHNGSEWVQVLSCDTCYNTAEELDFYIDRLPVPTNEVRLKVFLQSGENSVPVLESVNFTVQGRKGAELDVSPALQSTLVAVAKKRKAEIDVKGECDEKKNEVEFEIKNVGNKDMESESEYTMYRNGLPDTTGTFQLNKDATEKVKVAGNNDNLKLETKRYPDIEDSDSMESKTVDGCGEGEVICGDGKVEGDEECDDGNTEDGDGCSSTCRGEGEDAIKTLTDDDDDGGTGGCPQPVIDIFENQSKKKIKVNYWCFTFADGWSDCGYEQKNDAAIHDMTVHISCSADYTDGYPDKGEPVEEDGDPAVTDYSITQWEIERVCEDDDDDDCSYQCVVKKTCEDDFGPECGDGTVDPGEECDDGNTTNGDGCSSSCELEVEPECGNDIVENGEECDDGNLIDGDGCSAQCTIEPFCGDGTVDPGEECDDGNTTNGDGCSSTCEDEPICGDGDLDEGEDCDDGNLIDGDGCSSNCEIEPMCGDGTVDPGEECDDGNLDDGDGCSSTCEVEGDVPVPNPPLDPACGLDIVLVLDSSDSLDWGEIGQVKDAANGFVDALDGTPTNFGVVDFDTEIINAWSLSNDFNAVRAAINSIGHTWAIELTNWQAGITEGQYSFAGNDPTNPDLMVVITDGDPTTYGYPNAQGSYGGVEPDPEDINNAVVAANAAKLAGIRMLAVGITSQPTVSNLQKISGPVVGSDLSADVIVTDFGTLYTELQEIANELCGGTITVNKYISSVAPENRAGSGWGFDVAGTEEFTNSQGVTEAVELDPGAYSVTETTLLDGYEYASAICRDQNDAQVGSSIANGVENIPIQEDDIISCDVVNIPLCGNGELDPGEECDDGNTEDGDGCSSQCTTEIICGNRIIDPGEECDDGNQVDGDGCSSQCTTEEFICENEEFDFEGMSHGLILNNQYNDVGLTISAVANSGRPNTTIVFDTDRTGTLDPDLEVSMGNISIIPEDVDDFNGDGLVDDPNDSGFGGTQIFTFAEDVKIVSFVFIDKDGGAAGTATAYDENNDVITTASIPNMGDGSVQTITMNALGTRRLEITYPDSGGVTDFNIECPEEPVCGDGNLDPGEECDDGNTEDGDGCSSICTIPINCNDTCVGEFGCGGELTCADGSCRNPQCTEEGDCICPACGDGNLDPGEECDDGNTEDGDGCSSSCTIPNSCNDTCVDEFGCANGLVCSDGQCRNPQCTAEGDCICPFCGDGALDPGEECDDGNNEDGDGCSAECTIPNSCNDVCVDDFGCANGLTCDNGSCRNPQCTAEGDCICPFCGDGALDPGEECDDGNNTDGDGCSSSCTIPNSCNDVCVDDFGCANGLTCVEGACRNSQCTAEGDCICPFCGDGALDPGEECDDGNNIDGDGCSSTCTIPNSCNDVCVDDFGCANGLTCVEGACRNPQCTAEGDCICPFCGDGALDPGEECDDGNNIDGDGCSAECTIPNSCNDVCTPAFGCGNGLVCSDGACRNSECTAEGDCICPFCGDGNLDPGEECDDGNNQDGDGCSAECTIPNSCNDVCTDGFGCGNGLVCSDGACRNPQCTAEGDCICPACGDGALDPGEECDDGNTQDGDGCSADCTIPDGCNDVCTQQIGCGGGLVCSDGACRNSECTAEGDCICPFCGDGTVDPGEECDDGNNMDDDGCSSECKTEWNITIEARKIVCTDEADLPNWGASGGPNITATTAQDWVNSHDSCAFASNWNFQWDYEGASNPGDNTGESPDWQTFGPTDGTGLATTTIDTLNGSTRLWFREVWKDAYIDFTYNKNGGNSDDFSAEFYCHTDVLNYDNYDWINGLEQNGTYYCVGFNRLEPFCGDGFQDEGEECDDGNNEDGDGCSAQCTLPNSCNDVCEVEYGCGGGFICADGLCRNSECTAEGDCICPFCGDGALDPGEECDDGNTEDGDGCSSTCTIPNSCNDTCVDEFGCANGLVCSDGACRNPQCTAEGDCICPFCGDGALDPGEECDDGNTEDGDGCSSTCTIPNSCNDVCVGDFGCANGLSCVDGACRNPQCTTEGDCICPFCGDGALDPGEECDDGNNEDGDGCSSTCTIPNSCNDVCVDDFGCANGLSCVDGACRNPQCTTEGDCICPACGDGALDPGEECDDGNNIDGDGCSAQCTLPNSCNDVCTDDIGCSDGLSCVDGACRNTECTEESDCICPFCGDGTVDPGEECDDGNFEDGDGCSSDCTVPTECRSTCTVEYGCGNGLVCSEGECRNPSCTAEGDCICPFCGDGVVDQGEECDDGNNVDGDGCLANCTIPDTCDATCTDEIGCEGDLVCSDGACRNPLCTEEGDCICPNCGDGVLDPGEECDDGNNVSGDGCRGNCTLPDRCNNVCTDALGCDGGLVCSDGACRNAVCTGEIDCICPACGDGVLDAGEECDDGNLFDGDGCSALCTLEPPTPVPDTPPPLVVPPLVIPAPAPTPITPGVTIGPQYCLGTVYPSGTISISGAVSPGPGVGSQFQYSLTNGFSWNNIPNVADVDAVTTPFSFTLYNLTAGDYTVLVRTVAPDGTTSGSIPCLFSVTSLGLIFGANQFILEAQQGPLAESGIMQFYLNEPQRFYLEVKGATEVDVVNLDTDDVYPLEYNEDLKLWTGELVFDDLGLQRLEGRISNLTSGYRREINSVFVSERANITDIDTGEVITDATITVYERGGASEVYRVWNGAAYGQANPFLAENGDFKLLLPEGEFYIEVSSPTYGSINSLITQIPDQSVVTADVRMKGERGLFERFRSLFTVTDDVNNFPLQVTPLPEFSLLEPLEPVQNVSLTDEEDNEIRLFDLLGDQNSVIMVYSEWNTEAQEQIEIFTEVDDVFGEQLTFVPITTMSPDALNLTYNERGAYDILFLKPEDQFFDDYYIISLPHFFVLNEDKELIGQIVGSREKQELIDRLIDILQEEEARTSE